MKQITVYLLVVLTAIPFTIGVAASRVVDCQEVSAYFQRVDEAIADGMTELIEQAGFRETFERANQKAETNDTGFLSLPDEEREIIIGFMAMPGEALERIDEGDVPGAVRDLHESASTYWAEMPGMMRAISDDGPSAAIPFFDSLDAATSDNAMAHQDLITTCPAEVDGYAATYGSLNASSDVFGNDLFSFWDNVDAKDVRGVGYGFLFFSIEDEDTAATPAASTWRVKPGAA